MEGAGSGPYERSFELSYNTRLDTVQPERAYLFFPVRQLRKITQDTPIPPQQISQRDGLTGLPREEMGAWENGAPFGDCTSFKGYRVGPCHAR